MKIIKDNILEIINETKQELNEFKDVLSDKKDELPDISEIRKQLGTIEKVIKDLKNICNENTSKLSEQVKKLDIQLLMELTNKSDIMFEVISYNLPNGLRLTKYEEKDGSKFACLSKVDINKVVGMVTIKELEGKLNVQVSITGGERANFEVEEPLRMISIVSYINMKFNFE